ncbi:UNVERIFIED_CONTAM: hypothetical protein GTU68_036460 [Idotea baltica]|nr:hypothetical protein [Idotea baltica]
MGLVGRTMMRCYGFHWVGIKGRLASRAEAPILVVGPHSSFLDCVAVFWSKVPGLVNRIENLQLPFFGRYIDYTQPVYVWREDPNSRQNTILEIKRRVNSEDEWPQIMIFPEGTCTNRSCLITYKQGAFYPGVPVQPVVLRYPNKTDSITWTWDGPGAVKMLWVTLCQFHNYCEIEYLPVYNPSQAEIDDPWLYARNVRQVMADALDVPVVDYTYDDCRIMHKAQLKNLPCATGLIEFQKLRQTYTNLKLKEVEGVLMDAFAAMALSGAEVSLSDLSAYLRIPSSEATLAQLFNHYDKDGRGTFSFRDFVIYRSQFASEATSEKTVKWAFEIFDRGGEGRLAPEAFAKALQAAIGLPEGPASEIFKEVDAEANGYLTYGRSRSQVIF